MTGNPPWVVSRSNAANRCTDSVIVTVIGYGAIMCFAWNNSRLTLKCSKNHSLSELKKGIFVTVIITYDVLHADSFIRPGLICILPTTCSMVTPKKTHIVFPS